ncbi:hypothetical protein P168DRAFT_317147 [Aspergillus campestris IBT 28561]|uniref:F-box domain-containing protein n=1 Tax=Aspergillus campestris (strain IBT 28561) TaxID=1392248 RepID=A0A2I1D6W4_ASPC2|nr:uncharacterized protein P168DRAFT_317147 [Aspergillus campestris IBT 28561]PKY05620.1 hypothetical protein P168DRAFT_317147 [Aspergillus campestris IBT 28561]
METFPLNDLPPELIAQVIHAVPDPKDLRNLRLANRALSELATRELFREVYVHIDRLSDEIEEQSFEGVVKIFEKYPHLVQGLDVDGYFGARYDCLCPFQCAPYLDKLPNLRWVEMYGTYASWWSEEDYAGQVAGVLRRASLLTGCGERVLRGLRSLNLNIFTEEDPQDWFLGAFSAIFLIPQLQHLSLKGLTLSSADLADIPPTFQHQTELKSLSITHSYIDIQALHNILSLPRALTHLDLSHKPPGGTQRPPGWHEETCGPGDLRAALAQQGASLEGVKIARWPRVRIEDTGFDLSVGGFPRLRVYEGCYRDASGRFAWG